MAEELVTLNGSDEPRYPHCNDDGEQGEAAGKHDKEQLFRKLYFHIPSPEE